MRFYLGTHHPAWLARTAVPLFVSHRALSLLRRLPRALGPWALDSGGFTELGMHGTWQTSPQDYADNVRRFRDQVGGLEWAAIQDWMCEPAMLRRTGKTVAEHQELTIQSYDTLMSIAPDLPWRPVLQGWGIGDFWRHAEAYQRRGLRSARFGIGSVCRRQHTVMVSAVIASLAREGFKLHAFGMKAKGLELAGGDLESADSLAWSLNARRNPRLPGHEHASCANCMEYALTWREELAGKVGFA